MLLLNDGLSSGLASRMFKGSEISFFYISSVILGCAVLPR